MSPKWRFSNLYSPPPPRWLHLLYRIRMTLHEQLYKSCLCIKSWLRSLYSICFLVFLLDFKDLLAFIHSVIEFKTIWKTGTTKTRIKTHFVFFSFHNFSTWVVVSFALQQLPSAIHKTDLDWLLHVFKRVHALTEWLNREIISFYSSWFSSFNLALFLYLYLSSSLSL